MALVVKSLPAKAGDLRDAGSTLGSGRAPGEGDVTHSSTLAHPCSKQHCSSFFKVSIKCHVPSDPLVQV